MSATERPGPPVDVSLSANGSRMTVLNTDQPLVLYVSLTNYDAQNAALKNESLKAGIDRMRTEGREKDIDREDLNKRLKALSDGLRPVRTFRFGGRETWTGFVRFEVAGANGWMPCPWPMHLVSWSPRDQVAELDAHRSAYAEFGVDPEDVAKAPMGTHEVRAALDLAAAGPTFSNAVTVEFTGAASTSESTTSEDFLFNLASYYAKRDRKEMARSFLTRATNTHPGYAKLAVLMGDVLEGDGDLAGALRLYERALASYRSQDHGTTEEPEALLDRIQNVQLKLAGRAQQ